MLAAETVRTHLQNRPERSKSFMSEENKRIFIPPDEGAALPDLHIVHNGAAESFGGALAIVEWSLPPGGMIPPHTHSREDEYLLILEGQLTCDVDGEIGVGSVGSYVVKPRGVPHASFNTGPEPVRVMEVQTPGGFEGFYEEYEEIVSSGMNEEGQRKARAELGERYGVRWHDERIPEARARFGIEP
jgi:quercetin dioxygenase-like cupin family protein